MTAVWNRLPVIVRAVVTGLLVALAGTTPWAVLVALNEMKVEDPDGHVLRFGSDPRKDLPYVEWSD